MDSPPLPPPLGWFILYICGSFVPILTIIPFLFSEPESLHHNNNGFLWKRGGRMRTRRRRVTGALSCHDDVDHQHQPTPISWSWTTTHDPRLPPVLIRSPLPVMTDESPLALVLWMNSYRGSSSGRRSQISLLNVIVSLSFTNIRYVYKIFHRLILTVRRWMDKICEEHSKSS